MAPRVAASAKSSRVARRIIAAVPVEDRGVIDEVDAELLAEPLHGPDEGVHRAARDTGGFLIHTDHDKLVVAQVPGAIERHAMGVPLVEEGIDGTEQCLLLSGLEGTGSGKHPEAGRVGQAVEGLAWHGRVGRKTRTHSLLVAHSRKNMQF